MPNHKGKGEEAGGGGRCDNFFGVSEEMIQKAEKRAATVKTRRNSRRRRSSEDETDLACSVPSALYRKNAGRVRLMVQAAVPPFELAVETAFMPVHRVAHAVDNSDNIAPHSPILEQTAGSPGTVCLLPLS